MTLKSYLKNKKLITKNLLDYRETRKLKWNTIPIKLTLEYIKSIGKIQPVFITIDNTFSFNIDPEVHSISILKGDIEVYNYILPSNMDKFSFIDNIMNRGLKFDGKNYIFTVDNKEFNFERWC